MIHPYRKKMIEVALPLEAINRESAREKSIRHGHPSTLHLWWARRPLAACRAVLFASLVDDPESDPVFRRPDGSVDVEAAGARRAELFTLIEELVKWENSNNPVVINKARAEIAASVASRKIETGELARDTVVHGKAKGQTHPAGPLSGAGVTAWEVLLRRAKPEVVNAFLAEHAPPVLDPFCGGGSIPLEAQRLGLRAYASDLNPVPVLITKALIEIPPKFAGQPPVHPNAEQRPHWHGAQGLAEDVRRYGKWMRDEAEKRVGQLYPKVKVTKEMAKDQPNLKPHVGQELIADAWLWARTFKCANPSCRRTVPMVTSSIVSRKPPVYLDLVICDGQCTFRIVDEPTKFVGTQAGRGAKFQCPFCSMTNDDAVVREAAQNGQMQSLALCVACSSTSGTVFLGSNNVPLLAACRAPVSNTLEQAVSSEHRCVLYGFQTFASLFSPRQLTALLCFSDLIGEVQTIIKNLLGRNAQLADEYSDAVSLYLAFAVDRAADYWSQMTTWMPRGTIRQTFARQRIAMNWDWTEANPFGNINCSWDDGIDWIVKAILRLPSDVLEGTVRQLSATKLAGETGAMIISTDPPYYDNIPYADCSDYFYVWLRKSLGTPLSEHAHLLETLLTPKVDELVASAIRHCGSRDSAKSFFEKGLGRTFISCRQIHDQDYPLTLYYAFKQAESDEGGGDDAAAIASTGWETMLTGLTAAGLTINGTWPVRTERGARNISIGTNALASSIVLSCRSRSTDATVATRRDFLASLKRELPNALKHLQQGSIAPVDLAQAAIGPGMAVFTRFAKVLETDGSAMTVRTALGLINQALDEVLAEQEGEFDAETRWALAWFEQFGVEEGPFGVAETLSKAKNTAVNALVEAGILRARSGKVRLLRRDELPTDWDPATDARVSIWEVVQHLIRTLENQGEQAAAELVRKLGATGSMAETARDLAYRLYTLCERKKWAGEALAYNGLVIAWPELSKLALAARRAEKPAEAQQQMF